MAAKSQHFSNKVKTYALLPKTRRPVSVKGMETDEDKFVKHLERAAVLLEEQKIGNEEEEGGESEEDDGSDEEDELFYVEVDDVTAGSFGEGSKGPKGFKRFKDLSLILIDNGAKKDLDKSIKVDGGFQRILLYPWWELTLNLKVPDRKGRKIRLLTEPAQAKLRDDPGVDETIVSLFLNECGVHYQHILLLRQIAQRNNKHLLFKTLRSSIECMQQIEDLKDIAYCIERALETSDQGKLYHCSNFTKYCSALFPKDAHNIVRSLSLEKLQEIDDTIKENPWDLGYMVKTKERFGLTGTEVKLKGFIDSRILYKMPLPMQNALYVYNAMKKITYNDGHTYVTTSQLCRKYWYSTRNAVVSRSLSEKEIEQAVNYLTECDVLEKDHLQSGEEVIVFPHIKEYEMSIAEAVAILMKGLPCLPKTAVYEEDFGGDRDQLKAAEMMTEKPVVVMSGPGGCGKTYVISKLLSRVVIKCPLHDNDAKKQDGEKNKKRDHPGTDSCTSKIKREKKGDSSFQADKSCSEDWLDDYVTQKENLSFDRELVGAEMESSSFMSDDGAPQMQTHDDVRSAGKLLDDECLITAPTGRAAAILGRRGKVKAYTMHQVIYSYVSYCRKRVANGPDGVEDAWKFAGTRLLICDECSLISVRLFSMLVRILQCHARLEQIVLLGDISQLPSIEPGNLLSDVFQTLSLYSASIKLSTNHRAESQLIIENAKRISQQSSPVFDQEKGFVSVLNDNEETLSMDISSLLSSKEKHLIDIGHKKGDEKSQFIAFRRKDCDLINELCCQHYNQHATRDSKKRRDFRIGDKICATKNRDIHDIDEKKSVRITNGEIFFLREDHTVEEGGKKFRIWVIDDLERQIKADFKELRKLKIKHAYARTIHTYQGSESDIIIYVVGKPWYQTCQHVYTAITRGKRQAVVVYDESSLERAVAAPPRKRNTRLRYHLTNKLREYCVEKASKFKTGTELHRNTDQSMMTPLYFHNSESLMPENGDDDDFFSAMDDDILTPDVPKDEILTPVVPKDEVLTPAVAVLRAEILTGVVPKDEILTQDIQKYETLPPAVTKDETMTRDAPESASKYPEMNIKQEVDDEVFSDDDLFPDMSDDSLEKQKVDSDDEVLSSIDEGLLLPDMANLPSEGVRDVNKGFKHERGTVNASSTYGTPIEPSVECSDAFLGSTDNSFLFPSDTNMQSKTGGAAENAIRRTRQGKDTCDMSKEPNVYSLGAVQSSDGGILLAGIVPESDDEILSSVDENLLSSDKVKPVGESNENYSLMDEDSDDELFSCIDKKMLSPENSKKAVPGGGYVKKRETVKGVLFLDDVKQKDSPPSDFDSEDEFFSSIDEKILSPEKSKKAVPGGNYVQNRETVKGVLFLDDVKQKDTPPSDFESEDEFFSSIDEKILSPEKSKKAVPGGNYVQNRDTVKGVLFLDYVKQKDTPPSDFESEDEFFSSIDEKILSLEKSKKAVPGGNYVQNRETVKGVLFLDDVKQKDTPPSDFESEDEFFSSIDEKILSPEKSKKAVPGGNYVQNRETVKGVLFLDDVKQKDTPPSDFESEDEFFSSIDEKILSPEKSKKAQGDERLKNRETVREALFLNDINQINALSNEFDSDEEFFSGIDEKILSPKKSKKVAPGTEHLNNRKAMQGALFLDDFKQRDASSNDVVSDDDFLSSFDEELSSPERSEKTAKETEEVLKRETVRAALVFGDSMKQKNEPPKEFDSDDEFLSSIDEKILSFKKLDRGDAEGGKVLDGETLGIALSLRESQSDDSCDDLFSDMEDEVSETQTQTQHDKELVHEIVENRCCRSKSGPNKKDVSFYKGELNRVECNKGKRFENFTRGVCGAARHDSEGSVENCAPLAREQDGWLEIRSRNSEKDYFSASEDMEMNSKRHSERLKKNCTAKETDQCASFTKGDNRTIDSSRNGRNIPLGNGENDCKYVELSFDETDPELTEAATQYYTMNDDRGCNGISVPDSKRSAGNCHLEKNRLAAQDCRSPRNGLIIDESDGELLTQDYSMWSTVALVKDTADRRFLSDDNSDEDFLSDIDEVSEESQDVSFCRGSTSKAVSKQVMNSCKKEEYSTFNRDSCKGSRNRFDYGDIAKSENPYHSRVHSCSERSNKMGSHSGDDCGESCGTEVRTQTRAKKSRREQFESWSAGFCERMKDERF